MVRATRTKEEYPREVESLKQEIAESEVLEAVHQQGDEKPFEIGEGQLYKAVFDSANDVILLVDKKGKIIDINKRLTELGGYEKEELVGKNIRALSKIITRKSMAIIVGNLLKRMAGMHVEPYEVEMLKKNGESLTLEISARPLRKDGKIIGDLAILRDVTERKRAEYEIGQKTSELQLVNSINEAANQGKNLEEIIQLVAKETQKLLGGNEAVIYFLSKDKQYLERQQLSLSPKTVRIIEKQIGMKMPAIRIPLEAGGIYTEILKAGKAQLTNDPLVIKQMGSECTEDKTLQKAVPIIMQALNVHSVISVPINSGYEVFGLLEISKPEPFIESDVKRLETISKQIVNVINRKQTEEALRTSEQNLRNALDNSPMGIRIVSATEQTSYINRALLDIFGYESIKELRAAVDGKRYTPESYRTILERKEKWRQGEPLPTHYELDIVRKDGSIRNLEVFRKPILWDGRNQFQLIYRDTTEQKQAEETVRISEENYRNSFDSSPMGIRITDINGISIYANQAFLDIYGYRDLEEYMKNPLDKNLTPESYRDYREREAKQQSGERVPEKFISSIVRKDGTIRHLEIFIKEILWGGHKQFQVLCRDITEQKRAEETLKLSEQRLKDAQAIGKIGSWELDVATRKIEWSDEVYRLHERDKSLGPPASNDVDKYYDIEQTAILRKYVLAAIETGQEQRYDVMKKLPSGKLAFFYTTMSPVKNADGHVVKLFGTVQDITERKQVEERLRENRARFRELANLLPQGVWETDDKGMFTYTNAKVREMYDYREGDPQIRLSLESYIPEDRERISKNFMRIMRGETLNSIEYTLQTRDGKTYPVMIYAAPIVRDDKIVGARGITIDITEQKRTEEKLRESRARFRELADLLPQNIWEIDDKGTITYVNAHLREIYSNREGGPQTVQFLMAYAPEERERAGKNMQKLLSGEPLNGVEHMALARDGKPFPVLVYATPIIRDGKVVGARGITIDVTEQKQAEKRLEQAAQEWRATFDSFTDMVCILDKNFKITRVNTAYANLFKKEPKELLGKVCYELVSHTNCPHHDCPHQQTLMTGKPARAEFFEPVLGAYIEVSTSPILDENGDLKGSVHVMRDISERKQMEQQLMLTDRLASVGELAAGVAHELNNPLTSVIGFSQLLIEGEIPDAIKEDLSLINSEAQRAASIVKNLLTFARKHAAVKQSTRIGDLITNVLKLRAYEQKVSNIEVIEKIAPDLPDVMVDYFQVQQVFLNIIINAEFFMTESHHRGTLTISGEKIDHSVRISFADDGPGIPSQHLKRIFDPFFTTKEVGKGTGLGLSICHGIIAEHNGKIYAESEVGKGATFIVELPINEK